MHFSAALVLLLYTAGDEDFTVSTQTVTFGPGRDRRQCVQFEILSDDVALEGNENFCGEFTIPDIPGVSKGDTDETVITIIDTDSQ